MLRLRLKAYHYYQKLPFPSYFASWETVFRHSLREYYHQPRYQPVENWQDLPPDIRQAYQQLGLPEAEQTLLAGINTQYNSEFIYRAFREQLARQGVIFLNMDEALKKHPKMVKKYFGQIMNYRENKFAALNLAFWSGGAFLYLPAGIRLSQPIQSFFFMNIANFGQFEHTLIIAEAGSQGHYVESCVAPRYSRYAFHVGGVEVFIASRARMRLTSIQNWSKNVINPSISVAQVEKNGLVEWISCNLGSRATFKYPTVILKGDHSRAQLISLSWANKKQWQDSGGKIIHQGKASRSQIVAKSIAKDDGQANYRGLIQVKEKARGIISQTRCDSLLFGQGKSASFPEIKNEGQGKVKIHHEASLYRLDSERLFYLQTRGLSEEEIDRLLISGFIKPVTANLPPEYAQGLLRLINLEMNPNLG